MANAPKRPCPVPFCKELVVGGGRCDKHRSAADRERKETLRERYAQPGKGAPVRYTSSRWRKARAAFLAERGVCVAPGCHALATVVDHIVPHKGDERLFWDESNWQPLCKPCHDRKTGLEQRS